jgi:PAS domain S-box-containing protein
MIIGGSTHKGHALPPSGANGKPRQFEEEFEAILQRSSDGIVFIDAEGTIIEYNRAEERLTGISRAEAMGKKVWDVQSRLVPKERRLAAVRLDIKKKYSDFLKSGDADWMDKELEFEIQKAGGERAILKSTIFPVCKGPPRIVGSISVDITDLRRTEKELRDGNKRLLLKNIALHEVLIQVGEEKKRVHEQVAAQIERSVLPLLDRLKSRSQESDRKILQIIEENLQEATAGQEKRFSYKMNRLTQKEIEISDMIKRGMSCKEIGSLLNISFRTVETHRNRIRKKLGITDPGINLATMLRNM